MRSPGARVSGAALPIAAPGGRGEGASALRLAPISVDYLASDWQRVAMRLGRYRHEGVARPWAGVARGDSVVNVAEAARAAGVDLPPATRDLLATWRWREKVDLAVEFAAETGAGEYDAASLDRFAPVGSPGKIVCVGLNYADHAEESGGDVPDSPVLFAKYPTAVTGPGSTIEWDPALTEKVDYEAELVAVIGETARDVDERTARDHVAGYAVGNDVSARDLQFSDEQWTRGKSLDTFAPLGPHLVTADEVADPHDLDIWAEIGGDRLQDSSTSKLFFGIDELVAFCSRAFTLEPGDLIYTGTPAGVGAFREPSRYLEAGDAVTVGVEGLGELTNDCAYR